MPLLIGEVWPLFPSIAMGEQVQIKRNRFIEVFDVVPVSLTIAFDLGEREIVGGESKESQVLVDGLEIVRLFAGRRLREVS